MDTPRSRLQADSQRLPKALCFFFHFSDTEAHVLAPSKERFRLQCAVAGLAALNGLLLLLFASAVMCLFYSHQPNLVLTLSGPPPLTRRTSTPVFALQVASSVSITSTSKRSPHHRRHRFSSRSIRCSLDHHGPHVAQVPFFNARSRSSTHPFLFAVRASTPMHMRASFCVLPTQHPPLTKRFRLSISQLTSRTEPACAFRKNASPAAMLAVNATALRVCLYVLVTLSAASLLSDLSTIRISFSRTTVAQWLNDATPARSS